LNGLAALAASPLPSHSQLCSDIRRIMLAFSLRALPSRLAAAPAALLRPDRGVVFVVLGEDADHGLAVSCNRGRIVVNGFTENPVTEGLRAMRTRISQVLDKLESRARRVVVVSGEVQAFPLELSPPKRRRRAMAQLVAAARREFPDYLDMDGTSALLTVLPMYQPPDLSGFEDDEDPLSTRIPVMTFAVSRRHATAVEAAVHACGRRFAGLLPMEVFAFAAGRGPDASLMFQKPGLALVEDAQGGQDLAVLACATAFEVHGVRISRHGLERFAVEATGDGLDQAGTVNRLLAQLLDPGESGMTYLGGRNAEGVSVDSVRPWGESDNMECLDCPPQMPPQYMTAMGAAVAYFRGGSFLLLREQTSIMSRLKEKGLMLPLAAGLLLIAAGSGTYGYMHTQIAKVEAGIVELELRKQELAARKKRGEDLLTRYNKLRNDVQVAKVEKHMLEKRLPHKIVNLAQLLRGLIVDTPPDIMVTRFEKVMHNAYMLEGEGSSTTVISQYLLLLRNTPFVAETKLIRSSVITAVPVRGRTAQEQPSGARPLAFSIRMTMGENDG